MTYDKVNKTNAQAEILWLCRIWLMAQYQKK